MATALSAALKSSLFAAPSVSATRTQQQKRQTARYVNIRAEEAKPESKPAEKSAEKSAEKPEAKAPRGPKRGSMVSLSPCLCRPTCEMLCH